MFATHSVFFFIVRERLKENMIRMGYYKKKISSADYYVLIHVTLK